MRIVILLIVVCFNSFAQDSWKNIYSPHAWEARDKWQRADELLEFLNITSDSHVADIGCNEGYFTFKLSKAVGVGKVYAVDVDQSKLDKLKKHVEARKANNVQIIKGDYDDPKLPINKLDAVIILDTYHEMDDHEEILKHVSNSLKGGGRLVMCEPIAEERRKLSRADQERKHELGMKHAIDDLVKAGFEITLEKDPFINRTKEKGDMMWVVVATKL